LAVVPALPLSPAIARRCAEVREELDRQGKGFRARAFDLVIAATALEHRLELVTRNLADVADIPHPALYQSS
jgi:predicted nucleic acid-binding protein